MTDLQAELSAAIDQAEWAWLRPHVERVVLVVPTLNLVDVGLAIVNDNAAMVQQWIDDGWLHRPTPEQIVAWNAELTPKFTALIVQPYVLVQEIRKV